MTAHSRRRRHSLSFSPQSTHPSPRAAPRTAPRDDQSHAFSTQSTRTAIPTHVSRFAMRHPTQSSHRVRASRSRSFDVRRLGRRNPHPRELHPHSRRPHRLSRPQRSRVRFHSPSRSRRSRDARRTHHPWTLCDVNHRRGALKARRHRRRRMRRDRCRYRSIRSNRPRQRRGYRTTVTPWTSARRATAHGGRVRRELRRAMPCPDASRITRVFSGRNRVNETDVVIRIRFRGW